jgi:hypothetical protein
MSFLTSHAYCGRAADPAWGPRLQNPVKLGPSMLMNKAVEFIAYEIRRVKC